MKQIIMKRLIWIALCGILFSFSKIGGDSYTIHVNEKQILERYVHSNSATPSFSLGQSNTNDQISVYYNECGRIGKERKLSIRDEKDVILKEWQFANVTGEHTPMTCKAKDIIALRKNGSKLRLFYASKVTSNGMLLATIEVNDNLKASR